MAVLQTPLSSLYEPEIWTNYFLQAVVDKSRLIQSNIADNPPEFQDALASAGTMIQVPFFEDLPNGSSSGTKSKVVDDTDTSIAPTSITAGKDIAYKLFRAQSWQTANVVKHVVGSDPVQVVLNRYVNWWVKEHQRIALLELSALFDGTSGALKSSHLNEIHTEDGNSATSSNFISDDAIQDTRFLLGDSFTDFTAIIMHSAVYKRLEKLDLISFAPPSAQLAQPIPFYHGMRVLVDDTMTSRAGTTSGTVYDTYLFGSGALAFGVTSPAPDPAIELYQDPRAGNGGGATDIITRNYFVMHPRGVKFSGTVSGVTPSDTELSTATNWTKVYDDKYIRMACLRSNG